MGSFGNDRRGGGFSRGGGGRSFGGGGRSGGFGGRGGGFSRGGDREMFKTTCSNCGKDCEVPFRPTSGKPVYCSDCFEKMGNGRDSSAPRFERSERPERREAPQVDYTSQFEKLNAKLDRLIDLLAPKTEVKTEVEIAPKVKKAKKVVKK